jgi:hypothetical protein
MTSRSPAAGVAGRATVFVAVPVHVCVVPVAWRVMAPGEFVSLKFTVFVPVALADTLYVPAVALAVNVEDVAWPFAPVVFTHE